MSVISSKMNNDYILPRDFQNVCRKELAHSLTVFHLNTRSAKNKTAELEVLFNEFEVVFDIILFTETWYVESTNVFSLPTHDNFIQNRSSGRGGGVSLMVRKHISCEILPQYSCENQDYEVLTLLSSQNIFGVVYRVPDGNLRNFYIFLESLLAYANKMRCNIVLGGDFNINMLVDSPMKNELEQLILSLGCRNVIAAPTRVTGTSATLLDLFVTNVSTTRLKSGVIISDISDHNGIYLCLYKNSLKTKQTVQPILYQPVRDTNLCAFRDRLSTCDWQHVFDIADAERAYNSFIDTFLALYKECFPFKTLRQSGKIRKPWVTPELLNKIKTKDKLYKKFIKSRDPEKLKIYKSFRNKVTKELKTARNNYFCDYFTHASKRTDVTWKKLNTVLNRTPNSNPTIKINKDGNELTGSFLANAFNEYFVNLVKGGISNNAMNNLKLRCDESFFLRPVSENEVKSVFLELNNSGSCDAYGIKVKPVKFVLDLILPLLTHIFNLCLSQGVFPQHMQLARVSVLFKKGDRNNIENYRPVSILPVFSKGLEKVILSRMSHFCDKLQLLSDAQFGFRKHRSTELALLEQKEFILNSFEERKLALGIYVDFTKAFDYLDHSLLLRKLEYYGFRGTPLMLLKSYLSKRMQFVQINEHASGVKPILSGVPQGSILGPFLFNIFVNDIPQIDNQAKFVIYADDTTLLFSAASANELELKANKNSSRTRKMGRFQWAENKY